MNIWSYFKN